MARTLYNINSKDFKKTELSNHDLTAKAFQVYSTSDGCSFEFYESKFEDGIYWIIDCGRAEEIGTMADVNEYLESWIEDDEDEDI